MTRRRGRPPIGTRVEVRLPDWLYDDMCREAFLTQRTVAAVLRQRLYKVSAVENSTRPSARAYLAHRVLSL